MKLDVINEWQPTETPAPALDPRKLVAELKPFTAVHTGRSVWELTATLVPFFALILAMLWAVSAGYFAALLLLPVSGLLLLRTFIIQHDCGHGAYLAKRTSNDWLGRMLGVLTFTPYDCWRRSHTLHHASTGNLDARGFGDVDTLTVAEFRALKPFQRLMYRVYRHPVILFGIAPAYLFMLRHRLPIGLMRDGRQYWVSALGTNLAMAGMFAALMAFFGVGATLMVLLPTVLVAATAGVWLFYVQHQFEQAHWDKADAWKFHEAALYGSSHLDLPQPLRWFTGNIGMHHVHHLASRIPFYRLPNVLDAYPQLASLNRMTIREAFKPFLLTLWDEDQRRLISFREAKATAAAA